MVVLINQNTGELSFKQQPDFEVKKTYTVTIQTKDDGGKTYSETFTVSILDANDAPTVANSISNQSATEDSAFSFQFAANTFNDVDSGDSLTYTATLHGSSLPSWLSFDAGTRTFSGTPANSNVGNITVKVAATDGSNASVSHTFDITVANVNDADSSK